MLHFTYFNEHLQHGFQQVSFSPSINCC